MDRCNIIYQCSQHDVIHSSQIELLPIKHQLDLPTVPPIARDTTEFGSSIEAQNVLSWEKTSLEVNLRFNHDVLHSELVYLQQLAAWRNWHFMVGTFVILTLINLDRLLVPNLLIGKNLEQTWPQLLCLLWELIL